MARAEIRFKAKSDELAQSVLAQSSQATSIMDILVEQTNDSRSVFGDLLDQNEQLSSRYQDYLVTFDELVQNNDPHLAKALDQASNEHLAMALEGLLPENRLAATERLPEMRQKVIKALAHSMARSKSPAAIQQAQNAILEQYRNAKRSQAA